jgi:DNA mismatch endonuclease (patch repair protein)
MDTFSKAERSRIMAAVKSKDTTPELVVRRLVHGLGYRFRLHVGTLPGTPDIVLPRLRKIIEIRGCFWHGHSCGRCRIPATRRGFWLAKIARNRRRDRASIRALHAAGWETLIIWECQTRNRVRLRARVRRFLESHARTAHSRTNRSR